jgi:nickel-dependent lactate racemase
MDLVAIGAAHPWHGHPWLTEPGGLLAIGSVEPHYFAGLTGAHKTVTIGVAAYGDIERNHAGALDPASRPFALRGNPVYDGVAKMVAELESRRPVAVVNLAQVGSKLLAAAGGGAIESLFALEQCVRQAFQHRINQPADAVVAEVTGALARSFYQADKGVKNNEWAVRDGGVLVLEAACPGGVGSDSPGGQQFFRLLAEAATYEQTLGKIKQRGYVLGDHKAVRLRYLTDQRKVRLFLVCPGISAEQAVILGGQKADSVEQALARANVNPSSNRVYRVRDAGNVCLLADNVCMP